MSTKIISVNEWKILTNFTEIDKKGVDAKDVLKALRKLNNKREY